MPTPKTGEKHTPGPLEVHVTQNGNGGVLLWPDTSKGGVWKRRLDTGCDGVFPLEVAHVLAAAPDLLKALTETMKVLGSAQLDGNKMTVVLNNQISAAMERNRAAIAKATGEEAR